MAVFEVCVLQGVVPRLHGLHLAHMSHVDREGHLNGRRKLQIGFKGKPTGQPHFCGGPTGFFFETHTHAHTHTHPAFVLRGGPRGPSII